MKKLKLIYICTIIMATSFFSAYGQELETLKANYRDILLPKDVAGDTILADLVRIERERIVSDHMVHELNVRYPQDMKEIDTWLSLLNSDGSFSE